MVPSRPYDHPQLVRLPGQNRLHPPCHGATLHANLTLVDELRRLVDRQALRGSVEIPVAFGQRSLVRGTEDPRDV